MSTTVYSFASFCLFLTEIDFVAGDDEKFNTLVNAVNDAVRSAVKNPDEPEVLQLVDAQRLWSAVQDAHEKYGLSRDSGWTQCHLYYMTCVHRNNYDPEGRRCFTRHERLRFKAFMADAQKRCREYGFGGVIHSVHLGGQYYWEGEYRLGAMRPHRVSRYEDGGGVRWILFDRKLGQKKAT